MNEGLLLSGYYLHACPDLARRCAYVAWLPWPFIWPGCPYVAWLPWPFIWPGCPYVAWLPWPFILSGCPGCLGPSSGQDVHMYLKGLPWP